MPNVFIEYGIDFDNNRFGIGKSTEIEFHDGQEIRTKNNMQVSDKSYYLRFWFFKNVFIFSKKGFFRKNKNRHNFKLVFGISGTKKD